MSLFARLFRRWTTDETTLPRISESGEFIQRPFDPGPRKSFRFDFLRAGRRDIYTQTDNSIGNLTNCEVETVIRVPVNFRPATDEVYNSIRRRLSAKAAVVESRTTVETPAPLQTENESPPEKPAKKTDQFSLSAIAHKPKPVPVKQEGMSVTLKREQPKETLTFVKKEETKPVPISQPEARVCSKAQISKKEEPKQEDTFSLTNFTKKEEPKQEADTFSFTNFTKKEEPKQEEDTFSLTNFTKKEDKVDAPETASSKKEERTEANSAKPAMSLDDIRARFQAMQASSAASAPRFASSITTDFGRFSSVVNEPDGFSYEPCPVPEKKKWKRRVVD